MGLFTSQQEWKPTQETPSGHGDSFRGVQKFVMGAGAGRIEMNVKDGLFIGAETFATAPFSVDFNGLVTATNMTLTGGTVRFGKTSFSDSTNAGYILNSSGFYIGSASDAKYIKYTIADGTLDIRGSLNADDISAGTLIGRNIYANNGGSGNDVAISNAGIISFYNNGSISSSLASSGSDFAINVPSNFLVFSDDMLFGYNDDNDGSDCYWLSNADVKMNLTTGGELRVEDDIIAFSGIDFAEMFESLNGDAIPVGTSVVLEKDKVRPAKDGEIPMGVVSSTPGYICNGGESDTGTNWDGKYLKDDFALPIMEDAEWWSIKHLKKSDEKYSGRRTGGWVDEIKPPKGAVITVKKRPKKNPAWDSSIPYIPRRDRPEWNIIGITGRLRVKKGQPVAKNWIKLRDISEYVEEWLIR